MPPLWTLCRPLILRPLSAGLCHGARAFTTTSCAALAKPLPPRRVIPDSEIEENFLKGSGPGGQKINKTSSAVQLKHLPTGIVVKCQDTRSRTQNRKTARKILGERIEELELGEHSRTAIKAREKGKRKASADKKKRRKYRQLAEAKATEGNTIPEVDEIAEDQSHTEPTAAESAGKVG